MYRYMCIGFNLLTPNRLGETHELEMRCASLPMTLAGLIIDLLKSKQFRNRNVQSFGQFVQSPEGQILLTIFNPLIVFVVEAKPTHLLLFESFLQPQLTHPLSH